MEFNLTKQDVEEIVGYPIDNWKFAKKIDTNSMILTLHIQPKNQTQYIEVEVDIQRM